jgi:predicted nucleotidyltransferase
MVQPAALQAVVELLEDRFGLDALWLFGSFAAGRGRADSDIDLAALFRRRPTGLELLEAQDELGALVRRPIDLVDLDGHAPILAMEVLRHGKLMVDRAPARRIAFAARTPVRYEDHPPRSRAGAAGAGASWSTMTRRWRKSHSSIAASSESPMCAGRVARRRYP